ncbi:MAG: YceI family protein [Chloroflexi bacterium]|nr:YceI family protein [Chloroflexota bacterium]
MPAQSDGAGAPGGAASAAGIRVTIQPGGSEARYRAREVLVRVRVPSEAVGRARSVSGVIVLDQSGRVVPAESKVTVDLRQLTSNEGQRDRFARSELLQTSRFPNAEFVPSELQGIPWPAPTSGSFGFQLLGDLNVHGVTRPVAWAGTGQIAGNQLTATASTRVNITDFGMPIPQVPVLLSLEDALTLELDVTATID